MKESTMTGKDLSVKIPENLRNTFKSHTIKDFMELYANYLWVNNILLQVYHETLQTGFISDITKHMLEVQVRVVAPVLLNLGLTNGQDAADLIQLICYEVEQYDASTQ